MLSTMRTMLMTLWHCGVSFSHRFEKSVVSQIIGEGTVWKFRFGMVEDG
jgi:hypothetical protein